MPLVHGKANRGGYQSCDANSEQQCKSPFPRVGCFESPDRGEWHNNERDVDDEVERSDGSVKLVDIDTSTLNGSVPEVVYWYALEN